MLDCGVLRSVPVALTIAGSDPSGGAGLQADLKTFHQFGVFGLAAPTLITVQNTRGVRAVHSLAPALIRDQLACVQDDIPPTAAKTGALGHADTVAVVADWARATGTPLVVDPVMITSHGDRLTSEDAMEAMADRLLPTCRLVTPNLHEASMLAGVAIRGLEGMRTAAERIARFGVRNILVKGGHLEGDPIDVLWCDGEMRTLHARRIETTSTHGTGCTYSAAIAALLALGRPLIEAVTDAKQFVSMAIESAPRLGEGHGPLNFHADPSGR